MAEEQAKQFIEQATQSLQGGQVSQALELADQAVAQSPENAEAHLLRAIALSQSQQPQAATDAFRTAISLGPNLAKTYFNFGVHLYSQGQKVEALSMAQEAAKLEPTHPGARDLLLRIESESGVESPSQPQIQPAMPNRPQVSQTPYGYPQPAHTVKFVENMGGGWLGIAWGLSALELVLLLVSIALFLPAMTQHMNDQPAMQLAIQNAIPKGFQAIAWLSHLAMLGWLILDLADRRGNWLWLIPQVLCGLCGCGFITLPIYLLAGRKPPAPSS